jgi:hypothetical protein
VLEIALERLGVAADPLHLVEQETPARRELRREERDRGRGIGEVA